MYSATDLNGNDGNSKNYLVMPAIIVNSSRLSASCDNPHMRWDVPYLTMLQQAKAGNDVSAWAEIKAAINRGSIGDSRLKAFTTEANKATTSTQIVAVCREHLSLVEREISRHLLVFLQTGAQQFLQQQLQVAKDAQVQLAQRIAGLEADIARK